ncbi:50S ribosomal protein L23 [Patescibacteria group bacterium]|nr:50S ribosomal protein L23 [Patescibacteria group bacterium]
MAFLDIFKDKKRKARSWKKTVKEVKKTPEVKVEKKAKKKPDLSIDGPKKRKTEKKAEIKVESKKTKARISLRAWRVLKEPHITEKATNLEKENKYIFKVWPRINKIEVKKAIEDLYGVDVASIRIIRIPRKKRRLGKTSGWRKEYRKAIVKVKEGQKIELLPR